MGALINAIVLQHKMGRIEAAANYSRRVLELEPENYLAHATLGVFEYGRGNLAEALSSLRLALTFNPDYSDAKRCLATVLTAMGQSHAAVPIFLELLLEQPSSPQARRDLAQALDGVVLNLAGARERDQFLSLCMDDSVSMLFLNPSIIAFIKGHAGFQLLQRSIRQGIKSFDLAAPAIDSFLREPILLAALPRAPIVDAEVEEVLAYIRRCTLLQLDGAFASADTTPDNFAEFRFALARHCHFSGYIFHAGEDELQQVASLRKALEEELAKATVNFSAIEPALLAFSLYESLHVLAASERLLERDADDWSAAFRPIIREQLEHRIRERAIALDIPSLTPIDDRVSRAVRSQYEENPYPRWATVQFPKPEAFEVLARRLRPAAEIRVRPRPVPMIVAGCGTGHLPILYALLQPDSEILAVDLSLASLAYAARMTAQFGISNIAYAQADILELGSLGRRFAIVECSGVLHHLDNPMAGWRVLVDLMEPDGLMKISLYSQTARRCHPGRQGVGALPWPAAVTRKDFVVAVEPSPRFPEGHPARKVIDVRRLLCTRQMPRHADECPGAPIHAAANRRMPAAVGPAVSRHGVQACRAQSVSVRCFRNAMPAHAFRRGTGTRRPYPTRFSQCTLHGVAGRD